MSDEIVMVCGKCDGRLSKDWGGWSHVPVPGEPIGARRHKVKPVPEQSS